MSKETYSEFCSMLFDENLLKRYPERDRMASICKFRKPRVADTAKLPRIKNTDKAFIT